MRDLSMVVPLVVPLETQKPKSRLGKTKRNIPSGELT